MTTNLNPPGKEPELPASKEEQTPQKEGVKIGTIEIAILEDLGFGSLDDYYDENNQPKIKNA